MQKNQIVGKQACRSFGYKKVQQIITNHTERRQKRMDLLIDGLIVEPGEHPYEISIIKDKDLMEFNLLENIDEICELKIMKISKSACIIYNKLALLSQKNAKRWLKTW